ncbi:MAG: hypothetical protein COZ98_01715 [Candidatus Omnitrophica bacterium CG_4_8_14_3_um_filter_43_15]|nr:MAG: hypothetical protein AUJ89_00895 [Candidatus Omnitrophica bacterium CG1_02_43_210]PIR66192.1 MAG: hypothetical protein COU52_00215 [Candidatus Omnitrophica bacterium CG10_big_fil_rev_8_21_14_0_10_43_8]PIV12464.1 MAG: hypothetical protein COS48_00650 [Candidatus Omnitrophica bacterium CG03_land_8_20_14_0_80_43_22]PIW80554.1 MAG: hypothetical protein COZ98_01715 [Candidatus Omnitrophica bacterium CG_4_8_14_3_um_filter_43_15]PJC46607.1 MAG: hypothetical protein CO036_01960 [Candidatus Omni
MAFTSLSKREKNIFIALIIIISVSAFYAVVLEPAVKKWSGMDSQIALRQVKLKKYLGAVRDLKEYSAEYKKYIAAIKKSGSDEEYMAFVSSQIEETARNSGVYIRALKPSAVKSDKLYKKFIVETELDSPVKDLAGFLYQLQSPERMLKVDSMSLIATSGGSDSVKARVFISTVLFKD